jgi:hypothetical protein
LFNFRYRITVTAAILAVVAVLFRIFSMPEYAASVVLTQILGNANIPDKLASQSRRGGFGSALGLRGSKSVSSNNRFTYLIRSRSLAEFRIEHRVRAHCSGNWEQRQIAVLVTPAVRTAKLRRQ